MKKLLFALAVTMFVILGGVFAYAAAPDENEFAFVEITSDFNFDSEKFSTFQNEKTISGTAPVKTVIDIVVSTKNFAGKYNQKDCYTIEIGRSELFSQAIKLYVGENKVEFFAYSDNSDKYEAEIIVNRKKLAIKETLENSMYIPGGISY